MNCSLCEKDRKLIKAHIIPEAFFREGRDPDGAMHLLSEGKGLHPKRAPIGVYDKTILCLDCEAKLDELDAYGVKTFLQRFEKEFHPIEKDGAVVAFQSSTVDQSLLLRFLISVLWRASVSKQKFFGRVSLGPFRELASNVIENPEASIPQEISVVLSRWQVEEEHEILLKALPNPTLDKWGRVRGYRFYFGRIVAYFRVSSLPWHSYFQAFELGRGDTAFVLNRSYVGSKDFAAIARIAVTAKAPKGWPRL